MEVNRPNEWFPAHHIVRRIWSDPNLVLLIFAASAMEFAMQKEVHWLFYTGKLPANPIGRLIDTVSYAQKILLASQNQAQSAIKGINTIHKNVERRRGYVIDNESYKSVLYMLIAYTELSYELVYTRLSTAEKRAIFEAFVKIGNLMHINRLPISYEGYLADRANNLTEKYAFGFYAKGLLAAFQRHLGSWRYYLLCCISVKTLPPALQLQLPARFLPKMPIFGLVRLLMRSPVLKNYLFWALPNPHRQAFKVLPFGKLKRCPFHVFNN